MRHVQHLSLESLVKMDHFQKEPPVCTENLNPDVMVMKSAEDRVRLDIPDPLNGTKGRRIFVQRPVRSDVIVIDGHRFAGSGADAPRPRR